MLFSSDNPVLISFFVLVVFLISIWVFHSKVLKPIIEKHRAEKHSLIQYHTQLMDLLTELNPNPAFRIDEKGNITLSNKAGNEIFPNNRIIEQNIITSLPELHSVDLADVIHNERMLEIPVHINNREYIFLICGIKEYKSAQIYCTDVTLKAEAERKMAEALVKARKIDELKTGFLTQLSHEIRTPFTAIFGLLEIINEDPEVKLPPHLLSAAESIRTSGERLMRTLNLHLHMSMILTGSFEMKRGSVNVMPILRRRFNEARIKANHKRLDIHFEALVQDPVIFADEGTIDIIFDNILDNAVKYTHHGKVEVEIRKESKDTLAIIVSDTGIGMSEEFKSRLFDLFSQEEMGYNRPYEGNGLGLRLVRSLVEMNDGTITIDSKKNVGTTVKIIFPEMRIHEVTKQ